MSSHTLTETELASAHCAHPRYEIPDHIIALLLGLTFCVISPLIAPVALIYYAVVTIIAKYQLVYVYAQRFQSGGKVISVYTGDSVHAQFWWQGNVGLH